MEWFDITEGVFLAFGVGFLAAGLIVGKFRETKHIKDLDNREQHFRLQHFMITDLRTLPPEWELDAGRLVSGQAVIASDHFKRFLAGLRKLVGGRLGAYEQLMNRARREATLRMMEQAENLGCNTIWCFRQETSTVGGGPTTRGQVMAEVYVYGTAYKVSSYG